ncbi:MAG: glycosyltransferase [Candidatus Niyogibacteria bacterium]|nr:glycosyltransferase [Candidatus Niyogibacteria bacterium]
MKVLMISKDGKILEEGAAVRRRILDYGKLAEELHIVVIAKNVTVSETVKIADNIFAYPVNFSGPFGYVARGAAAAWRLAAVHHLGAADLVTCQDPFESGLVGWLAAKRFHLKLQLQIHTDFLSPFFRKGSLLNKIRVRLASFLLPRADGVRVVSQRIKESLKRRGYHLRSGPRVVPIFVDVKKIEDAEARVDLRAKYPQFDFVILMASRLTREKNIGMAINVVGKIAERHPGVGLVIVGDGPEQEDLRSQILKQKIGKNIIMENWTEDLPSYYKTADLFLLTSNYEGYGMSVAEAMAAGCPVIMTDVGLAGDVLINGVNGLVVPVGEGGLLEAAILDMMEDQYKRGSFVKKERETIFRLPNKESFLENYQKSWESCVAR